MFMNESESRRINLLELPLAEQSQALKALNPGMTPEQAELLVNVFNNHVIVHEIPEVLEKLPTARADEVWKALQSGDANSKFKLHEFEKYDLPPGYFEDAVESQRK